jgi:DUF1680 family protein
VAKWLEAVGHTLSVHPDPMLEQLADDTIELIAQAQQEDALVEDAAVWNNELYRPIQRNLLPQRIKAIPYFLWGNRGKPGKMCVWIRTT